MATKDFARFTLEKCAFWHGILTINDSIVTSFFDIKFKKDVPDPDNYIAFVTNDIPAYPIAVTDNCHVSLNIENNISGNSNKIRVCDVNFSGSELQKMINEVPNAQNIDVETDTGEWSFSNQNGQWILRGISVYIQLSHLRKFVKDA
ncbi:hypothetical protein TVAG_094750 [Trichomonas vaginalis G3]|uniref:Uncharacterized protein n=1 Tax=Trichomonas vaginalis (strain ATCC PRA-98 / G3) TaxID=412133 RepID=A2FWA4_TRIV3|nr:hypothetical protein TVAGG3_0173780 [Trichomonas vaginalis G3]EAX90806.1 hypothetical protein TVAG_094750 [Trichomonas vaginalis G3]KAI5548786.1 hypothetical protein TVAGG3_0173780 [Trichomonas vaginalis G3]|eukprot:XP_001303736.1 hypothetical protein [Trichomonas vaginalis G3]